MRAGCVRIGCSGWDYPDWRGLFYPSDLARKEWFSYYASRFATVEINNTFYRLPSVEIVDRWRDQAPPGFVYAVKVGRYGSHRKKLRDPQDWLGNHLDRVRHLGPALGPNLIQLPPRWRRDPVRLDDLLAAAPRDMRWAVEVRDPSWLHDEVFEVLRRHDAALCIHDLLADHPLEMTTDWTYLRFHGPQARVRPYTGTYGERGLERIATWLAAVAASGSDIHAYFNNDVGAASTSDAGTLAQLMSLRAVGSSDRTDLV